MELRSLTRSNGRNILHPGSSGLAARFFVVTANLCSTPYQSFVGQIMQGNSVHETEFFFFLPIPSGAGLPLGLLRDVYFDTTTAQHASPS